MNADEARAAATWYWQWEMGERMPKTKGLVKQLVNTPDACVGAYGNRMFFMHPGSASRERPFSIEEQLAFERTLVAYCERLGISSWRDRSTVSERDAPPVLATLRNAARAVARGQHSVASDDDLVRFVDNVVRNKPLPVYAEYERRSLFTAASRGIIVPEPVVEWLSGVIDEVCADNAFGDFARDLLELARSGANTLKATRYGALRVFVPRHCAYVRCELPDLDNGYPQLALVFRRHRTSGESLAVECLLTTRGEGGQGGAFWWQGWRKLGGANPLDAAKAALVLCASAPRCAGVGQADCADVDKDDRRGWRALNLISQTRLPIDAAAQTRLESVAGELPQPVGALGPGGDFTATRRDSSAPPPESALRGASTQTPRPQTTPGSGKRVGWQEPSYPTGFGWAEGRSIVWRSPLCSLVCADVLADGASPLPPSRGRCAACAARSQLLLAALRRIDAAQADLSGQLPDPSTSVLHKFETPGRALAWCVDLSQQLKAAKAELKRLLKLLHREGIELTPRHADVVDKLIQHVDSMRVADLDERDAAELGVCMLAVPYAPHH